MADLHPNQGPKQQNFIASVLFAEIAGYADRPVFEQIQYTTQMRQLLERITAHCNSRNFLTVDREDSVILLFPGDPIECFDLAKLLTEELASEETHRDLPLYIGVNLGPVTLGKNELSMPQVSGVGVEDAARVARAGLLREVLISRAYYTVFARISQEHGLLQYREFISDEADESFAIYQIAQPSPSPLTAAVSDPSTFEIPAPPTASPSRWRYAGMSALVALSAFALYQNQRVDTVRTVAARQASVTIPKKVETVETRPARPTAHVAAEPAAAPPVVETAIEPTPELTAQPAEVVANVNFHHAITPAAPSVPETLEIKPVKSVISIRTAKPVTVRLAIKPWGEIYVDGKKVAITPPTHNIKVSPGKRQIMVRNGDFLPYRATFDVRPESLLQISHDFDK